jgi:hypothetical protein
MVEISAEASYQIVDPLQFRRTLHNHQNARRHLENIVTAQLREEIAGLSYRDMVVDDQQLNAQIVRTLEEGILDSVKKTLNRSVPFGVEVLEVRIGGIQLAN